MAALAISDNPDGRRVVARHLRRRRVRQDLAVGVEPFGQSWQWNYYAYWMEKVRDYTRLKLVSQTGQVHLICPLDRKGKTIARLKRLSSTQ